ncbi:MAG: AMP-binding protein [Rhodospirillales bacterium]|nr:AMP-binding protein [Rhodospirillales bacterium]
MHPRDFSLDTLLANCAARHGQRLAAVDGSQRLTWAELDARVTNLARWLLAKGIVPGDRIALLRQATLSEERLAMERELAELEAREALAPQLPVVLLEIERIRRASELDFTLAECRTQPITLKAREAAKAIISDRLRSNFQSELRELGSESPVEVTLGAGEYGEHPYEMKLQSRPDVGAGDVLSEGGEGR